MTASFIPVFTDYMRNRSREETWAFANRLFWTFSAGSGRPDCIGRDLFSADGPLVFDVRKESGSDRSRLSESSDVSVHSVHRDGGPGDGDSELLSCVRMPAATPILLNISFIVFSMARCLETFLESGGGAGGRRSGRRHIPIFPAGAATGSPGNEFPIWSFIYGSGSAARRAPDGSRVCRNWHCADQSAGGHDFCECQDACRKEAWFRSTSPTV